MGAQQMKRARCEQGRGFTLLELMVSIAMVAILVTVALPSYSSLRQEQLVKAATQAIYTDMMLLKSESIKRNQGLSLIIFNSGQSNWCYRIAIDGAATCTSCSTTCSTLEGRKGGDATEFPGIALTASYSESASKVRPVAFSPRRGSLPAGNIQLTANVYSMQVVTNNLGRVRSCAPTGSKVGGVPAC